MISEETAARLEAQSYQQGRRAGRPVRGVSRPPSVKVPTSMLTSERGEVDDLVDKLKAGGHHHVSRSSLLRGALLRIARRLPDNPTPEQLQAVLDDCLLSDL